MATKPLTPKQQAFLEEYLRNGRNASAAYRKAYNAGGMKEASVNRLAHALVHNVKIASRLEALAARAEQRLNVTADDVTLSAARAMMASLKRTLNADGVPLPMSEWPDDLWLAIDGYEIEHHPIAGVVKTKVKLASRTAARDQLAKHLGWYEADNHQKGAAILAALDQLPADVAARLRERLRAVAGRGSAAGGSGLADAGSSRSTTH